ncbi:MAG: DPP IV N-terminal domain-containing protein [Ignavibacteria bacterium]|nr:DPP IV N-terminal domain-containing protein [Ignavibacteria bacterium]
MKILLLIVLLFTTLTSYSQKKLISFSSDATKNDKQQIFIMDEDGDNVKQISQLDINCYAPKFSPDGRKIVFSANNRITDLIYMIDLDDTSTFRLPVFIDGGLDPVFSPDGSLLMYRSEKDEDNNIYIYEIATGESYPISDGSLSTHGEFSPDGEKVIYSSSMTQNFDLVLLDLNDTTEKAQKTIVSTKDAEIYGTFHPEGKLIAFASFDINYKGTLKTCDINGKNIKTISSSGSSFNPKFSPDGKYLAFVSNKSGNFNIYICKPDGSNMKQLTSEKGNTVEFEWSGDSKKIVYDDQQDGVSAIWIINVETGKKQNLTGTKANNITPSIQR